MTTQLWIGFLLAVGVAVAARTVRSLSRSGMYAAILSGTIIFGLGGWQWAILLLTFFFSSTALTRAFKQRKREANEKYAKGGERDAGQVFGNGSVATLFAALHCFYPQAVWPWIGFAASLAAVNADTWATELGVLNPRPPHLITNLSKKVEKGTSGGISLVGTLAALAGSALIALLAVLLSPSLNTDDWLLITLSGLAGSLFDSLLGATTQAIYYCSACQKETERHPLHACGTQTQHIRGWTWLDNDWVNFACGATGAMLALAARLF
ncbi:MAG: DUF92 domain-containing protein [Anaerolineales bacterium]